VLKGLSTGEGLAEYLVKHKGQSVLAVEEEFAKFLKVMARPENTLSMVVRVLSDTGDIDVTTRKEPIHVRGANLSVIGHITPEELAERLDSTDAANGFGNRFPVALVQRSKVLPRGGRVPDAELGAIVAVLQQAINRASTLGEVYFTDAFYSLWEPQYRQWEEADSGGIAGKMKARAGINTLRLALIYALQAGSRVIDREHLEAALAVWRYCAASIDRLFGESTGNAQADRIIQHLVEKYPDAVAKTSLYNLFGKNISVTELDRALLLLEDRKEIEQAKNKTGGKGRPKQLVKATDAALQRRGFSS
jgi:hypothetical protein